MLSERAAEFERGLARWRELVDPGPTVTAAEQRFVAQTLLGAWPLSPDELQEFGGRIEQYLRKALREAKQQTNWIHPDERHTCATRYACGAGSVATAASTSTGAGASTAPMKRNAFAITCFSSRRSMTRSSMPFSSRNSLR